MLKKIEAWFNELKTAKDRVLRIFFELPGIRQVFKYITPNQLCYFRIFAAIIMMWLFMTKEHALAFGLFIFASLTDFIDGPLARWKNQVTVEGANLDPIADKVLISIPLLLIGIELFDKQSIAFFLAVELLLVFTANALKPFLRSKFSIPLSSGSNGFGQTKMLIQTLAVGVLLYNPFNRSVVLASEMLLWISILFGILSFFRHLARMDKTDTHGNPIKPPAKEKRIITIPNIITVTALFLCIPAGFALMRGQFTFALWILVAIFFSDWLDGWIAQRFNQVTHFGAAIDSVRNFLVRFLLLFWFVLQLADMVILTLGISTAVFELVSASINSSTARKYRTTSLVTFWAKARAFTQFICFGILLADSAQLFQLTLTAERILFGIITFASLVALLSYYGQRQRFHAHSS